MPMLYSRVTKENYANKTLAYFGTDSAEHYQLCVSTQKQKLIDNGWFGNQTPEIAYKFNSSGFRCEEFTNNPTIMFLGCSHTFGLGIPYENTWPYLVSRSLNLVNINLAWPGTSNDTAFRTAYHYATVIKPKILVLLCPEPARTELILQDSIPLSLVPSQSRQTKLKDLSSDYDFFYNAWISSDTNIYMNRLKNVLAIDKICSDQGIKFLNLTLTEFTKIDSARDLLHHGLQSNKFFAESVLFRLSNTSSN